jgi:hypothetical protein
MMTKKWVAKHLLAVQTILLLIGMCFSLASAVPSNKYVTSVLLSLGIAITTGSVFSLIHTFFGTDTLTLIEQVTNFNREVFDLGLSAVNVRLGKEDLFETFKHAQFIDMMYNTGKMFLYDI